MQAVAEQLAASNAASKAQREVEELRQMVRTQPILNARMDPQQNVLVTNDLCLDAGAQVSVLQHAITQQQQQQQQQAPAGPSATAAPFQPAAAALPAAAPAPAPYRSPIQEFTPSGGGRGGFQAQQGPGGYGAAPAPIQQPQQMRQQQQQQRQQQQQPHQQQSAFSHPNW